MLQHDTTPSKAGPLDDALAEDINKSTVRGFCWVPAVAETRACNQPFYLAVEGDKVRLVEF